MPDVNPQSLDGYVETTAPSSVPPAAVPDPPPRKRLGRISFPLLVSLAGLVLVIAGGAIAWWLHAHQAPWFVGKPLYTQRSVTTATKVQKIHSTLLYRADGKYAATNTVYEYGKPPAEQNYTGAWRQDGDWTCLRMDWLAGKEFCNAFIKTDSGWVVLNRANAQITPIGLTSLPAPSDQELAPPAPPPAPVPPASCSFADAPVAHAASVTAFLSKTVSSGQPCKAEVRTCTNGELSGSYPYATCSAAIALPPLTKKSSGTHQRSGR